jgi:hypothetical protein
MTTKTCIGCGEQFETSNDSDKCRSCTLNDLTGGLAPEEGDFNTAAIQSGTMSAQERRWLQQDLESVEVQDPFEDWEEDDPFDDDDYWEDLYNQPCECGAPPGYCICDYHHQVFACPTPENENDPWWDQTDYREGDEEAVLAEMQKKHDAHCGCGYTVTMPVKE